MEKLRHAKRRMKAINKERHEKRKELKWGRHIDIHISLLGQRHAETDMLYVIYMPMEHLLISIFLSLHLFFSLSLPPKTKTLSFIISIFLATVSFFLTQSPKCPFDFTKRLHYFGGVVFVTCLVRGKNILEVPLLCFLHAICIIVCILYFEGPTLLLSPYHFPSDHNKYFVVVLIHIHIYHIKYIRSTFAVKYKKLR